MADATPTPTTDPPDPFSAARTTLRETLKWLATTFAGLIGVVIAGTSLTGVTKLSALNQQLALLGCGIGLICLVVAIGVMLQLLLPQTFYFGELLDDKNRGLLRRLDSHAIEILPPEFKTIEEFIAARDDAVQKMRANRDDQTSRRYQEAATFLDDSFDAIARLTYLANYELLRSHLRRRQWLLFVLAIFAIGGLGMFAVRMGAVKPLPTKPAPLQAHVSLDLSPPLLPLRQPETTSESLNVLLETVVKASVTKGAAAPAPECRLEPLLALVQTLASAGAMPKNTSIALRDALIKSSVDAGKDILVGAADGIIGSFFPPAVPPPASASVDCCCRSCAPHPSKNLSATKRLSHHHTGPTRPRRRYYTSIRAAHPVAGRLNEQQCDVLLTRLLETSDRSARKGTGPRQFSSETGA